MEEHKSKYAIHEACRQGQTTLVESLLTASPKLAFLRDPDDRLPIHWSASYNHFAITSLLASQPRIDIDATDASGWTALMMSCSRAAADSAETISLLLAKGADVNAKTTAGQTALHFCASKANVEGARTLLARGASARVRDKRGMLALHRAAAVGCVPVMKALLGEGKSPVNAGDADGMTALHHAVCEGHGDAALVLLVAGAEWDRRDKEGRVALEYVPDAKTRAFIVQAAEREGIELEG